MRRALASFSITLVASCVVSCSAITSFEGFVGDAPLNDAGIADAFSIDARADGAALDGASTDAKNESGVGDASVVDSAPPGTVILTNGFESGCQTSDGAYQATLTPSTTAHSGNMSCEVCYSNGSGFYTLDEGIPPPTPSAGSTIYGQAWVRAVSSTSTPQTTTMSLRTFADDQYDILEETQGDDVALSTDWQLASVTFAITKGGAYAWDYYVGTSESGGGANPGDCFLIDDIVITQLQ